MSPRPAAVAIARVLSVIGHPALLMPAAVAGSAAVQGAPPAVLHAGLGASVGVAVCVIAYSLLQVRAGRWSHADASVPHERSQLTQVLVLLLFGVAAGLWWLGAPRLPALGLALGGGVVLVAHLLRQMLKVSLHTSFAVYAAGLLWPGMLPVGLVLALAAAVSWSRLVLRRHTPAEVVAGAVLGAAVGAVFNVFAR